MLNKRSTWLVLDLLRLCFVRIRMLLQFQMISFHRLICATVSRTFDFSVYLFLDSIYRLNLSLSDILSISATNSRFMLKKWVIIWSIVLILDSIFSRNFISFWFINISATNSRFMFKKWVIFWSVFCSWIQFSRLILSPSDF